MITASGINMMPGGRSSPTPWDIAIAMCRITRYAGALWVPLSVHSILVADFAYMASKEDVDWAFGLLHDAHETVTGEVTRHWKPSEMKPREAELDERIFRFFNLDLDLYHRRSASIKAADEKALAAEALFLKLPDWPMFYERNEKRLVPKLGSEERETAVALFGSSWMNPGAVLKNSVQAATLAQSLDLIRTGDYRTARARVS